MQEKLAGLHSLQTLDAAAPTAAGQGPNHLDPVASRLSVLLLMLLVLLVLPPLLLLLLWMPVHGLRPAAARPHLLLLHGPSPA
jgi:hypothetical protein